MYLPASMTCSSLAPSSSKWAVSHNTRFIPLSPAALSYWFYLIHLCPDFLTFLRVLLEVFENILCKED